MRKVALVIMMLAVVAGGAVGFGFAHAAYASTSYTCPTQDAGGFPLGQTNYTTDPIFCSYPAFPGENPNDFYCTYSATTGVLVTEHDAGFCPANAVPVTVDNDLAIASHANITTDATGPGGAVVTYTAPAVTDPDDTSPPTAVCNPHSGSTFPIGTTTVTCTATDPDDSNSPVSTTFTVTVEGAAAQLASLYQDVKGYGFYNILALTVSIAQHDVAAGHPLLACQSLKAFITDARLQLPAASAAPLIAAARQIEAVLGCPF